MKKKNNFRPKLIFLKDKKKKKKPNPTNENFQMSDDQIALNTNADTILTFIDGLDKLIETQTEIEKRVNKGEISKSFARFLSSWEKAFMAFERYYEAE